MELQLDHVTVAGPDLAVLQQRFAAAGLAAQYGGLHSNGVTHMSTVGFDDGSYIELISTAEPGRPAPWWNKQITLDGGPCAWCVRSSDIGTEAQRLKEWGLPVRGPSPFHRERPDGTKVEWELAFPGAQEAGAVLPFLIQDRTPRELRIQPAPSVHQTELAGVATVVIGVADLVWNAQLFQQIYGWVTRETRPAPELEATIVSFIGTPVALATPISSSSWLASRLAKFGDSPALFLLQSRDLTASATRLPAVSHGTWLNRPALWFEADQLGGTHLGII
jgi:hypothetical protein